MPGGWETGPTTDLQDDEVDRSHEVLPFRRRAKCRLRIGIRVSFDPRDKVAKRKEETHRSR